MAKKSKKAQSEESKSAGRSVVEKLDSGEAASVLTLLLERHPELRSEAEAIGADLLSEVSFLQVADGVENAVLQLDYDDLNPRAGRHSWGYVEPTEAAWELLEEAVAEFVDDMNRYLDLGLEKQAQELCQGVVLGLYRVRHGGENDVLGWAPDFPGEQAGYVVEKWKGHLPPAFVAEHIPEWGWAAESTGGSK